MSAIGGFCDFTKDCLEESGHYHQILEQIHQVMARRGPDQAGTWLDTHAGLSCAGLSVMGKHSLCQPFLKRMGDHTWAVICSGEIYNAEDLRYELTQNGRTFETENDGEVLLTCYLEYGPDFVKRLNGAFALAIWDPALQRLLLFRDRSGIQPLFYSLRQNSLLFASEIKGIFVWPEVKAQLDRQGLNEIFSIGPARTCGCGVFRGISEVLPGHYLSYGPDQTEEICYWKLESRPHEDNYADTVNKTTGLVLDAIRRQMKSDIPICTFLSGGLDSSLVSAVCAAELKKRGKRLDTFSFDFTDNDRNFKASSFQPSLDRPYVDKMTAYLGSNHHYLECGTMDQADYLKQSVDAHDLPAMADVDSSLLYFCSQVTHFNKVALTGECADEVFGGYPWYHKKECFEADTFPWTMDLDARKVLLRDDFLEYLNMEDYIAARYQASIQETPRLAEDTAEEARRREIAYLNQRWFMQTLLNRMDRDSMYCGLEARVPFADHRLLEYIWNVPWEMKARDGVVKGLLRECGKEYLPPEILNRRKSPYPKTYDTRYEAILAERVQDILDDSSSPVLRFLDRKKVNRFLSSPSDYGKPWYGQLMAGPQMLAYIWQINYWLQKYQIEILP